MTQLELVILNLAINSRDARPNGGRLTVATRKLGLSDPHRPAGLAERDYVVFRSATPEAYGDRSRRGFPFLNGRYRR